MNKKIFICATVLITGLILVLVFTGTLKPQSNININIFSSANDCTALETMASGDINIERFSSPLKDSSSKGLKYNAFYGCNYTSKEVSFILFAYEFVDSNEAKEYYKTETGKNTTNDFGFSDVKGLTQFRRIVVYHEKAYLLETSKDNIDEAISIINNIFDIELVSDSVILDQINAENNS